MQATLMLSPFRPQRQKDAVHDLALAKKFDERFFTDENYYYEEWHIDQARVVIQHMFRRIHPKKHWVFLDVGCALGGMISVLRRRGFKAYGTDVSQYCIQKSPVRRYLRFGSATNLPCRDLSVDVTTCLDTFQYLTRDEARHAARELRRITKRYLFFECITKEDRTFSDPKKNPDTARRHSSLLTSKEYVTLFEDAGFTLCTCSFLPRVFYDKKYRYDFSSNAIFETTSAPSSQKARTQGGVRGRGAP